MPTRAVRTVLLLILPLLAACQSEPHAARFPVAAPSTLGIDDDALRGLVDLAQQFVDDGRIIGAEIMVIKQRRTVLHEAVGWSDRDAKVPLAKHSFYRLRSMTKPFTGTAAMMLIDRGQLRLDSRPAEFFPSWDNERSRAITVEQLLAPRSGFVQSGWPVPAASFDQLQGIVDACGEQGPEHEPGSRFTYSDVNSFTLGALVTRLSGMPVEDFIKREIFTPLGLRETHVGYTPDAAWAARMNPTYQRDEATGAWETYWTPAETEVFPYFRASGGLISTITDYAWWVACWMEWTGLGPTSDPCMPPPLLSKALIDRALTPWGFDEYGGYGYHWSVHGEAPLAFGHSGSDGTLAVGVPAADVIVLYFTQSRGTETMSEWLDAARALKLHVVDDAAPATDGAP